MNDRRLPIYILVDVSKSMDDCAVQITNNYIQQLVADLYCDPRALETVWLSLISFADEANQVVPLVELESFHVPELPMGGKTNLGGALSLLCECANREVRQHEDYYPMVFLFTDGKNDVGDFDKGVREFKNNKWGKYVLCAVGPDHDVSYLKRVNPECVLTLMDIQSGALTKYVGWVTMSDSLPPHSEPLRKQLLAYIVFDSSDAMRGLPIEAVQIGLRQLSCELSGLSDTHLELFIGVVGFNDDAMELVEPIQPSDMKLPTIEAKGCANIGKALKLVSDSVTRNSSEQMLPPIVFIISADGRSADGYEDGLLAFQKQSWGRVVVCAAGNGADVESLRRIEKRNVVQLKDLRPTTLLSFFDWIAQAIKHMASEATGVVDRRGILSW